VTCGYKDPGDAKLRAADEQPRHERLWLVLFPSPRSPGAVTAPCPSQAPPLFGLICLPACLIMVVEMLTSFNMYSGRERHHRTAA
jgi:hypothetical protein